MFETIFSRYVSHKKIFQISQKYITLYNVLDSGDGIESCSRCSLLKVGHSFLFSMLWQQWVGASPCLVLEVALRDSLMLISHSTLNVPPIKSATSIKTSTPTGFMTCLRKKTRIRQDFAILSVDVLYAWCPKKRKRDKFVDAHTIHYTHIIVTASSERYVLDSVETNIIDELSCADLTNNCSLGCISGTISSSGANFDRYTRKWFIIVFYWMLLLFSLHIFFQKIFQNHWKFQ